MNNKKIIGLFFIILFFISFLVGCGNKSEIEEVEEQKIDLVSIIKNSRTDSENSLYEILEGKNGLIKIGINKDISNSVVSLNVDNKAYCVAIVKVNEKIRDSVIKGFEEYASEREEELYKDNYDESLIASKYTYRNIDNYIIFVMSENSDEVCETIENNIIMELG